MTMRLNTISSEVKVKKLSKEEFVARATADMSARRQAQIDLEGVYCRYAYEKRSQYLRRCKKYLMDK